MAKPNIRKKEEFEAFISIIKSGSVCHWMTIAGVLGIDKDTITEWKKLPEARYAIANGIQHAIKKMEASGKNDWRMWKAKLQLLGVGLENVNNKTSEHETDYSEGIVIYKPQKYDMI